MIREDGNKLAQMAGDPVTEMKYYLHGELVSEDPYADLAADPDAAVKYDNWYEAATLVKETLDTAYMAYLDKDFEAALDNVNTAYYSIYEESGLSHTIYTDLSLEERQAIFSDPLFKGMEYGLRNLTGPKKKNLWERRRRRCWPSSPRDWATHTPCSAT